MKTVMLFRNSLILFTLAFLIQACEKDPEPLTSNSVIRGIVNWYSVGQDNGKVKITAKGPYGNKSVEAVKAEGFSIDKLGNGTYKVEYAKDGFGTVIKGDVQLFGFDTVRLRPIALFPKPGDFKVPVLTRASVSYPDFYSPPLVPCISIETDAKDQNKTLELMIFMKSASDVSWNDYQYVISGRMTYFNPGKNCWVIYISLENQSGIPFQSGEKVFIKTYACNVEDWGYIDADLGLTVFSTLDKSRFSNVIECIMP
jgi:hypothetical protein